MLYGVPLPTIAGVNEGAVHGYPLDWHCMGEMQLTAGRPNFIGLCVGACPSGVLNQ